VRIVHVTRELGIDRRYGIGRSLSPVILALADLGHEVRYLTQDDQTPRSSELQRALGVGRDGFGVPRPQCLLPFGLSD
jgi:hypothetical protein